MITPQDEAREIVDKWMIEDNGELFESKLHNRIAQALAARDERIVRLEKALLRIDTKLLTYTDNSRAGLCRQIIQTALKKDGV